MRKLVFVFCLSILTSLCYGQDTNNELLKKLVEKEIITKQEAEEINKSTAVQEEKTTKNSFEGTVEKVRNAFNTPYMQFGGYGLFMYNYNDTKEIKHSAEPRVIFLSMQGKLSNTIRYFILADVYNTTLHEFYINWAPAKEFSIRGGQMKTPLSFESQISLTDIETIFNTRSISTLTGMGDDVLVPRNTRNSAGRDIGIRVNGMIGKNDLLEYTVGLFQGTGINTSENNNTKDLAAALTVQPVKGFRIGGGAYFGEAKYSLNGATVANHVRNRWIASTDYVDDRLYIRAEWLKGNDGGINKEGLYGMASYYIVPDKWNVLAKVDYLNRNQDINSEVIDYLVGINYYFYKKCRLQLNYTYSDYSAKWGEKNSHAVAGQLQIAF